MPNEEMSFCQSACQSHELLCVVITAEDETVMLLKPELAQISLLSGRTTVSCHATFKGLPDDKGGRSVAREIAAK